MASVISSFYRIHYSGLPYRDLTASDTPRLSKSSRIPGASSYERVIIKDWRLIKPFLSYNNISSPKLLQMYFDRWIGFALHISCSRSGRSNLTSGNEIHRLSDYCLLDIVSWSRAKDSEALEAFEALLSCLNKMMIIENSSWLTSKKPGRPIPYSRNVTIFRVQARCDYCGPGWSRHTQ